MYFPEVEFIKDQYQFIWNLGYFDAYLEYSWSTNYCYAEVWENL